MAGFSATNYCSVPAAMASLFRLWLRRRAFSGKMKAAPVSLGSASGGGNIAPVIEVRRHILARGLLEPTSGLFPAHPLAEPTTHRLRMFILIIAKIFVSPRDGLQVRPGPEASAADRGALARKRREGPTPITRSVIKSSESSIPTQRRGAG